jgi:hypothetical protein
MSALITATHINQKDITHAHNIRSTLADQQTNNLHMKSQEQLQIQHTKLGQ